MVMAPAGGESVTSRRSRKRGMLREEYAGHYLSISEEEARHRNRLFAVANTQYYINSGPYAGIYSSTPSIYLAYRGQAIASVPSALSFFFFWAKK